VDEPCDAIVHRSFHNGIPFELAAAAGGELGQVRHASDLAREGVVARGVQAQMNDRILGRQGQDFRAGNGLRLCSLPEPPGVETERLIRGDNVAVDFHNNPSRPIEPWHQVMMVLPVPTGGPVRLVLHIAHLGERRLSGREGFLRHHDVNVAHRPESNVTPNGLSKRCSFKDDYRHIRLAQSLKDASQFSPDP